MPDERVISYVDGHNLYYGLREKGWRRYYWLNIQALVQQLLDPDQTLVQTKYFTTVVKRPADKRRRQGTFLDALMTLDDFHIYYGKFLSDTVTCRNCGDTYETHHEKMTDVNIAVEMLADAFRNRFDVALLISADSDLAGVIREIQSLPSPRKIVVVFPPGRSSYELKQATGGEYIHIDRAMLAKSQFPNQVTKPDGFVLHRPTRWQ